MEQRFSSEMNIEGKITRDAYNKGMDFIRGNACFEGKILVLYGLRRTGKTTIMEQMMCNSNPDKCAFFQIEEGDSMCDIKLKLIDLHKSGINIVFLDEITNATDFVENAAVLADVYAKKGMKIITAGTDSLGFLFAEGALYDRTVRLNTTHISFAEHCRVLGTNDMDDYIEYGGLMSKGKNKDAGVYDYISACKYLDESVSENIVNSLEKADSSSSLVMIKKEEMRTIVEKMVEKYSGKFSLKIAQNQLNSVSVLYASDKLIQNFELDDGIIESLTRDENGIIKDFSRIINADIPITTHLDDNMLKNLESYLMAMHVISSITKTTFSYTKQDGWHNDGDSKEIYIIQPAIKYYHLKEGIKFIEKEDYYLQFTAKQKEYMKQKLDEKIKGDMTEQIVVYDTSVDLPCDRYFVTKPEFYIDGKKCGEYDMLVYDKQLDEYWGFEIKHTTTPNQYQQKHLKDDLVQQVIDRNYGKRENVAVLYRGESFKLPDGALYINISDFLCSVSKHKDMTIAMKELVEGIVNCVQEDCNKISNKRHGR